MDLSHYVEYDPLSNELLLLTQEKLGSMVSDYNQCKFFPKCGNVPRFHTHLIGEIPWRRKRLPTPVFLPGKSHGQRSLAGCSPWVAKNQTRLKKFCTQAQQAWGTCLMVQWLRFCNARAAEDAGSIPGLWRSKGEGNSNPLQYSCLENPMNSGAW